MVHKRRNTEAMSLAFLDVISCGFGAIILLLVLTRVFEPVNLTDSLDDLEAYLANLRQQAYDMRDQSREMHLKIIRRDDKKASTQTRLAELKQRLAALQGKFSSTSDQNSVNDTIRRRLETAQQTLTEEMKRLLANFQAPDDNNVIGGIPIDSEYVIFIIDTSGSMKQNAWPLVLQKVAETLSIYPKLKGIQVMNDMGTFMFSQYSRQWIPDTQARRKAIIDRLSRWEVFSNSSPVEGITQAISSFYKPNRKISLYVFGDEFSGRSIQSVINQVDRINHPGADGEPLVRIHAIGFPVVFDSPANFQITGIKFAILMRELCARNNGTFVALNDHRVL